MKKYIIFLLILLIVPPLLVASGVAFISMDLSLLNPEHWSRSARGVAAIYWLSVIIGMVIAYLDLQDY